MIRFKKLRRAPVGVWFDVCLIRTFYAHVCNIDWFLSVLVLHVAVPSMLATPYLIPVFDLYDLMYATDGATSVSRTYRCDCDKYSISDLVSVSMQKKRTVKLMEGTVQQCHMGDRSQTRKQHRAISHIELPRHKYLFAVQHTRVETRPCRPPEIKQKEHQMTSDRRR